MCTNIIVFISWPSPPPLSERPLSLPLVAPLPLLHAYGFKSHLLAGDSHFHCCGPTLILNPKSILPDATSCQCLDAESTGCSTLSAVPSRHLLPFLLHVLPQVAKDVAFLQVRMLSVILSFLLCNCAGSCPHSLRRSGVHFLLSAPLLLPSLSCPVHGCRHPSCSLCLFSLHFVLLRAIRILLSLKFDPLWIGWLLIAPRKVSGLAQPAFPASIPEFSR